MILRTLTKWLLGYDFFLSYSWDDAVPYASALESKLANLDLVCFQDRKEGLAGQHIGQITRALRRSRCLLVVASRGSVGSKHVKDEITRFKSTGRPIIVVDAGFYRTRAAQLGEPWSGLAESIWVDDSSTSLTEPSPFVVSEVASSRTSSKRLNIARSVATALLLALSLIAIGLILTAASKQALARSLGTEIAKRQNEIAVLDTQRRGLQRELSNQSTKLEHQANAIAQQGTLIKTYGSRIADLKRVSAKLKGDIGVQQHLARANELLATAQRVASENPAKLPLAARLALQSSEAAPSNLPSENFIQRCAELLPPMILVGAPIRGLLYQTNREAGSPISALLVEAPEDKFSIHFVDMETTKHISTVRGLGSRLPVVSTDGAGRMAMVRLPENDYRTVAAFDIPSGIVQAKWRFDARVSDIWVSPGAEAAAVGLESGACYIVDGRGDVHRFPKQYEPYLGQAWSPQGDRIASRTPKGVVIFTLGKGFFSSDPIVIPVHATALAWGSTPKILLWIGTADGVAKSYDGEMPIGAVFSSGSVDWLVPSPLGRHVSLGNARSANVWKVKDGAGTDLEASLTTLDGQTSRNSAPAGSFAGAEFNPQESAIAITQGEMVRVLDLRTGNEVARVCPEQTVSATKFTRAGKQLALVLRDGSVRNYGADATLDTIAQEGSVVGAVDISADGSRIAVPTPDMSGLRLVDVRNGQSVTAHLGIVRDLGFMIDDRLAVADNNGLSVLSTGQLGVPLQTWTLQTPLEKIRTSFRSSAVVGSDNTSLFLFRLGRTEVLIKQLPFRALFDFALSPDGKYIAAVAGLGDVATYRLGAQGFEDVGRGHLGAVPVSVAFMPDSRGLVITRPDGRITFTSLTEPATPERTIICGSFVAASSISKSGLLATSSSPNEIRFYDVSSGSGHLRATGTISSTNLALRMRWNADGKELLVNTIDGEARVLRWPRPPANSILKQRLIRIKLSVEEAKLYLPAITSNGGPG